MTYAWILLWLAMGQQTPVLPTSGWRCWLKAGYPTGEERCINAKGEEVDFWNAVTGCTNKGVAVPCNYRDPEPMDVPAVQERKEKGGTWMCLSPCSCNGNPHDPDPPIIGGCSTKDANKVHWEKGYIDEWTCADKSRVLLTSEDGKRHCIKFGGN